VEAERLPAIVAELERLDLVDTATAALETANRAVPTVTRLKISDIRSGKIADLSADLVDELTGLADQSAVEAMRDRLVESPGLDTVLSVVDDAAKAEEIGDSPRTPALIAHTLLEARFDDQQSQRLADYLAERNRLDALTATFLGIGFDPEATGERTFWLLVLSLMVCVVGIVNSMMMAVTERFREIATMKCLGAMDSFILKAFLIESGSVGVVGACLGAVLGLVIVVLQASIRYGGSFWAAIPVDLLALAAVGSLLCGIVLTIFGALLPAYRAARMHPIEAMRLET